MFLWKDYRRYRISPAIPSNLRQADVARHLDAFQAEHAGSLQVVPLGESVESRPISMLTLGNGNKRVLAWTQMHGNEPTHTAALLDLINFLLQDPEHPSANAILTGCQLHMILMLNPDGAERWTRRNAQDLDINRDALHRQSPEGQLLRTAVNNLQPDFALNLHNHRPYTTVGQTQHPASLALLVPPIDLAESETANVLQAKQLAGYLAQRVAPYCPGPVSRYDADFMPRCFGEWVQQQGAATMTIEAGGWSTVNAEPLVQLHFYGLIACLEAIATGGYLEVAADVYDSLPPTGQHDQFDHLLRDVTVVNGLQRATFRGDIGINFSQAVPIPQGGKIVDLGDLHVTSGKILTAEADLIAAPGRFAWLEGVSPRLPLEQAAVTALLAAGVTTVLGQVDLTDDQAIADLARLRQRFSSPLNIGFLGKLTAWSPEHLDRLLQVMADGVVGVLGDGLPPEAKRTLSWFDFPMILSDTLPTLDETTTTLAQCASQSQKCARLLDINDRGTICLGATADLALWRSLPIDGGAANVPVPPPQLAPLPKNRLRRGDIDGADVNKLDPTSLLTDSHLQRVIVGGNVVFDAGEATGVNSGRLLGSRLACS